MERYVTYSEILDLKDWMVKQFVTKAEFEQRISELEQRFEQRLEQRLEQSISELKDWVVEHFVTKAEFAELVKKVEKLTEKVEKMNDVMLSGFDRLFSDSEKREQEYALLRHAIQRIEEKLGM